MASALDVQGGLRLAAEALADGACVHHQRLARHHQALGEGPRCIHSRQGRAADSRSPLFPGCAQAASRERPTR